jgi:checkpoint serine/threonine-protein kinase
MIDFGVSIDVALFPPGTTFTACFEKADNRCPEMLDGRPWTYQVEFS